MTLSLPAIVVFSIIGAQIAVGAAVWRHLRVTERADGAPGQSLIRWFAALDLAGALGLLVAERMLHQPLFGPLRLWRHDPASAIFIGALAGLFLNVAGSGSPLVVASLALPASGLPPTRGAAPRWTVALLALGEIAAGVAWFGVALGTALSVFPRLVALMLLACGYGSRRALAGQDHLLLGAVDGLLLGLLAIFSRSIIAALLARAISDALAYVRVAGEIEEEAGVVEGQRPAQSG